MRCSALEADAGLSYDDLYAAHRAAFDASIRLPVHHLSSQRGSVEDASKRIERRRAERKREELSLEPKLSRSPFLDSRHLRSS